MTILWNSLRKLRSTDSAVVEQGIAEIEKIGVRALPKLVALFENDEEETRRVAATALGKIRDEMAVEPLINLLWDRDDSIRMIARQALLKRGDGRSIQPLEASDIWQREVFKQIIFVKEIDRENDEYVAHGLLLSPIASRGYRLPSHIWKSWILGEKKREVACHLRILRLIGTGVTSEGKRMTVVNEREYVHDNLSILRHSLENSVTFCLEDTSGEGFAPPFFLAHNNGEQPKSYHLVIELYFNNWHQYPDVRANISASLSFFQDSLSNSSRKIRAEATENYRFSREEVARTTSPTSGNCFPVEIRNFGRKIRGAILLEENLGASVFMIKLYSSDVIEEDLEGKIISREINWWEKNVRKYLRADVGKIIGVLPS